MDVSAATQQKTLRSLKHDLETLHVFSGTLPELRLIQGAYYSLDVSPAHLLSLCEELRDRLHFDFLASISGVDMLEYLEVVYHLRSLQHHLFLQIKVKLAHADPHIESVVRIWESANWHERETYDLFGIRFDGHPDLRRMFLDDDFQGHPLLKSFHQTPMTVKDPSTTRATPVEALTEGNQQQGVETVVSKRLGQGLQERLHPGTPTFGHAAQSSEEHSEEQSV